jgi:signal transduction histidine kinase
MLRAAKHYLQAWARRKEKIIPFGFSWMFIVSVDVTMMGIGAIATAQRPLSDWPIALIAMVVAFAPWLLFFVFDVAKWEGLAIGTAWTLGTAILLFATSTPIEGDFAPLLLSLTVGVVTAITSLRRGAVAAGAAGVVLLAASLLHRLDTPGLYLAFVGIGWLIGHLVRVQQQLLTEQRQSQARLAAHVVADERRRIAREVHDVIAHSLSITLLHLTAARHALQHDNDSEDAVLALQQAERLGREAMTDIRHTVGLLDDDPAARTPEPDATDIACLAEDFQRAGLDVTLQTTGDLRQISASAGLAMYRVAQESLANIAKHAPKSPSSITLTVSGKDAVVCVVNRLSVSPELPVDTPGRGMRGMRQRIELIGGTIEVGPCAEGWSVRATVPVEHADSQWPTWTGAR